jgi:type IV pilus assembly protein PilF
MFGLVYMQLKETNRAEESFERALRLSPNDADINHNYGWFLCQTGREPASIKYFLHAVRNPLYPTPWRSYSAAGVCTLRTEGAAKQKDAEAYFERALRLEPDEPTSLLNLAQIRYRQGSVDDARKLVARHNKVAAPSSESLWLALRIERKLGERIAEQSYANQLRRRFPQSREFQALQRGQYD